jgi:hypothetical protein
VLGRDLPTTACDHADPSECIVSCKKTILFEIMAHKKRNVKHLISSLRNPPIVLVEKCAKTFRNKISLGIESRLTESY